MDFDRAVKNVADDINSVQQFSAGDQEALQDVIEDYFTIPHSDNLILMMIEVSKGLFLQLATARLFLQ